MPSAAHVAFAVAAIARVQIASPGALILVDPILGDLPKGLYIEQAAATAIRDALLPCATFAKLNAFELEWLTGARIGSESDAAAAGAKLALRSVLVTSVPARSMLSNVLFHRDQPAAACRVARLDRVPKGTGDLLSALLLAAELGQLESAAERMARAVAGVDLVVRASRQRDELCLVASLTALASVTPFATTAQLE